MSSRCLEWQPCFLIASRICATRSPGRTTSCSKPTIPQRPKKTNDWHFTVKNTSRDRAVKLQGMLKNETGWTLTFEGWD